MFSLVCTRCRFCEYTRMYMYIYHGVKETQGLFHMYTYITFFTFISVNVINGEKTFLFSWKYKKINYNYIIVTESTERTKKN